MATFLHLLQFKTPPAFCESAFQISLTIFTGYKVRCVIMQVAVPANILAYYRRPVVSQLRSICTITPSWTTIETVSVAQSAQCIANRVERGVARTHRAQHYSRPQANRCEFLITVRHHANSIKTLAFSFKLIR